MDPQQDSNMVSMLLEFKARLQCLLEFSFSSNERFMQAIKDAFEQFINARQNRPAELIAKFVDSKLKPGHKVRCDRAYYFHIILFVTAMCV